MMDSKEGIEKVAPVDAQAAGLLDPSFLWPGTHNAATADLPRERAGSPTGSAPCQMNTLDGNQIACTSGY